MSEQGPETPRLRVAEETLVFDRVSERQVMLLDGTVVLPVGAVIELMEPGADVTVVGIRLLADGTVCLDVDVPREWWVARFGEPV